MPSEKAWKPQMIKVKKSDSRRQRMMQKWPFTLSKLGSTPTPRSGPFRDHGLRPWSQSPPRAQKTLETKGFLGLERPFLDLVSQTPRPRGGGRPLFADPSPNFNHASVAFQSLCGRPPQSHFWVTSSSLPLCGDFGPSWRPSTSQTSYPLRQKSYMRRNI